MINRRAAIRTLFASFLVSGALMLGAVGTASANTANGLICSGCVNPGDIANGAVQRPKIANFAVNGQKLSGSAVTTSKLATGAVARAKIRNNAVDGSKIQNGTVAGADLAPSAKPAGVDFVTAATSSSVALATADAIIASVTITAPAAGVVIVNANGWFNLKNSVSNHARCSVTTGGFVQTATAIRARFPTFISDLFVPMARTRVFPLAGPGSVTYNLVCDKVVGNIDINDATMSAIYVPQTY